MRIIVFGLILCFNSQVYSQKHEDIYFLDFEETDTVIRFNGDNNIWMIGSPNKSIFSECHSGRKAIMTDTVNPYPINNKSSFSIIIDKQEYDGNSSFYMEFYHTFNCDTITDSLFVDFSFDGGETWNYATDKMDIFDENNVQRWFGNTSYGIINNMPVLSGNSSGWVYEQYFMDWFFPVKKTMEEYFYPDSIICRFNFISDGIQTNKDGWIIDDIKIQSWLGSAIGNKIIEDSSVYPNPFYDFLHIKSNKIIKSIRVYTPLGRTVINVQDINSNNYEFNTSQTNYGLYFLVIKTIDDNIETSLIIKK